MGALGIQQGISDSNSNFFSKSSFFILFYFIFQMLTSCTLSEILIFSTHHSYHLGSYIPEIFNIPCLNNICELLNVKFIRMK